MVEQVGAPAFDEVDGMPRMRRGVVVRHLLLPGNLDDSKAVVALLQERFGSSVLLSLMNQYTPVVAAAAERGEGLARATIARCPELARPVPTEDYEALLDFADALGVEDYFWQEGGAAEESFIPPFDLTGL